MTNESDEFNEVVERYNKVVERACRLLPAWFVSRMMTDEWSFGLLLTSGLVMAITHIDDVRQAADQSIWIDVEMLDNPLGHYRHLTVFGAPTSRLHASVNAAHVVAAFELADT